MEQIDYNLLFRWFVGLPMDASVWHATVFTHNRDRVMEADVAQEFLSALMGLKEVRRLLSSEHFPVDGTLIEAFACKNIRASMKSFRPKDGSGEPPAPGRNGERDFHKEKRTNETHASTSDPEARLYRKAAGRESRLCSMGHAPMENRDGLAAAAALTQATGTAERGAALAMLDRRSSGRRITPGADKAYDVEAFVGAPRERKLTPHIAVQGVVSKTGRLARRPSTRERCATPATRSANASGSASRRSSAGSRSRAASPGRSRAAEGRSRRCSPSRSPPAISSARRN